VTIEDGGSLSTLGCVHRSTVMTRLSWNYAIVRDKRFSIGGE
jgi:hypothetical protein